MAQVYPCCDCGSLEVAALIRPLAWELPYATDVALKKVKINKNDTNELIYKADTDSQTSKTDLKLPKEKRWREGWTGSLALKVAY